MTEFFSTSIPSAIAKLIDKLLTTDMKFLNDFYLSGDTALSLQLGHRESEDLDFFSEKQFDPLQVQKQLEKLGQLHGIELSAGTLNTYLRDVKLQFLEYPYPLLVPPLNW